MRVWLGFGLALGLAVSAVAQGDPATVQRILDEGKERNQAPAIHHELCTSVGARMTGSASLTRAVRWAAGKFTHFGLPWVGLDRWGETIGRFDRGPRQRVTVFVPEARNVVFTTPNWTVGTQGPVRGHVVREPETLEALVAAQAQYKGAYVLMSKTVGMRGPSLREPTELDKALDTAGIVGRVYHTDTDIVWTHGTWRDYTEETRPKTPMLVLVKDDWEALAKAADADAKPELEADVEVHFSPENERQWNVVAEIPGTEKPDEVVIVCGHLDSWNGPGSQGANDNGTGTSATLEAARILTAVGARPKRTIRFILWTGEEQGLLGSVDYVKRHLSEMPKIMAVLNEDSGPNWHAGIAGTKEMMPTLQAAVAPMADAFEGKPMQAREVPGFGRGGGSDHAPFLWQGVPAFFMQKGGNHPYRRIWHTQNDHEAETDDSNLVQMSTNLAVVSYNLACADQLLPRVVPAQEGANTGRGAYMDEHDGHQDGCGCTKVWDTIFTVLATP